MEIETDKGGEGERGREREREGEREGERGREWEREGKRGREREKEGGREGGREGERWRERNLLYGRSNFALYCYAHPLSLPHPHPDLESSLYSPQ